MELKKSSAANNESLRVPIMLMGLLFVGGVLLASFTYEATVVEEKIEKVKNDSDNSNTTQEAKKPDEPETVEPPKVEATPPPAEEIVVEENKDVKPEANVDTPPPPIEIEVEVEEIVAEIIDFPDVEAGFPGGNLELQKWISANVVYPETAIEMDDQGKVYLSFVVEANGDISNIVVEKKVSKELDREAKRVLRKMPKWNPGEAAGKKVRTRCRLPIVFTLE